MRFSVHKSTAHIGQVEIRGVQHVVEFEAREPPQASSRRRHHGQQPTEAVSPEAIDAIQSRTAIVVPCKDEPVSRIVSVWAGIPASSLIVLVSASAQHMYARERDALARFCRDTGRDGISAHQRDVQLAKGLREVGMTGLLGDDGLVHGGKGEALVVGIALAAAAPGPGAADGADPSARTRTHHQCHGHNRNGERNGRINSQETEVRCSHGCPRRTMIGNGQHFRGTYAAADSGTCRNKQSRGSAAADSGCTSYYKYVGFIDADNFVTGSVSEYCKAFSAAFHLVSAPDAMVRINWGSKPKVHDGEIVFKTSGRSSEVVNRHFNQFLGHLEKRGGCTFSGGPSERVENDQGDMELHHICTGNAGEHAMTMSLALKLRLASGYAIEPFHFLDLFDQFSGSQMVRSAPASLKLEPHSTFSTVSSSPVPTPAGTSPCSSPISETTATSSLFPVPSEPAPSAVAERLFAYSSGAPIPKPKVQILQIRTMNPHFHDSNKGEAHVIRMWMQGLSALYHSQLTAGFAEFRHSLWEAILAGGLKINGSTKHNLALPPTPPMTQYDPCSTIPPSFQDIANASGASLEPAKCRIYQPAGDFDLAELRQILLRDSKLFWCSAAEPEEEEEEALEDDVQIVCAHDGLSSSGVEVGDPAQEMPLQHVARRDSGVDFDMVGAGDHAGLDEQAAPGIDLHQAPTRRFQLDMMNNSIAIMDELQ
ncbi:mannosyl-3-phosphoglycerate synthase [Diaporthe helianthi]|uniref:Mannosyl-3-phosphoglycerate synthase n=1 Tax=Diaporthe helianthi TaxID=158607 RepID=A0A2P5I2M2_DIAHE|nr:mannosyl-3-phosphoglycerate synthase [Diaporthe helianthi]